MFLKFISIFRIRFKKSWIVRISKIHKIRILHLWLNLSVAEASLRLDEADDLQCAEVDLQPLVDAAVDELFRTPRAAALLSTDPSDRQIRCQQGFFIPEFSTKGSVPVSGGLPSPLPSLSFPSP